MAAMAPQFQNLIPGANNTGSTAMRPYVDMASGGSIGDKRSPLVPQFPSGQATPGPSNPYSFPANTGGSPLPTTASLSSFPNPMGYGGGSMGNVQQGMEQSGIRPGMAQALTQLLASGMGYSPQAVQALLASLQPQIARGKADIMEQFGSAGLGQSSAAAIGLGDFESQVALNEGQLISNLYEQSVQNYMQVLMGIAGIGEQYQGQKMASTPTGLDYFNTAFSAATTPIPGL